MAISEVLDVSTTGLVESRAGCAREHTYDPTTAQFLTRDPLFAITGERYGYAGNDPINGSDPSGLCSVNPFSSHDCYSAAAHSVAHTINNDVAKPVEQAYHGAQNLCIANSTTCPSLASQHKTATDLLYVTLGVSATIASFGLLAEVAPFVAAGTDVPLELVGQGALASAFGGGAAVGDYGKCFGDRDQLACAGFYTGAGAGALGFLALLPGELGLGDC